MIRMLGVTLILAGIGLASVGVYFVSLPQPEDLKPEMKTSTIGTTSPSSKTQAVKNGKSTASSAEDLMPLNKSKSEKVGQDNKPSKGNLETIANSGSGEETNEDAGLAFEKYVVQKFNMNFFTLKHWAGDKFVNGIYDQTTQQPDLFLELTLNDETYPFYVECKWRSKSRNSFVQFANQDQLIRYQELEKSSGHPVFIVLGYGGKPSEPGELFVFPASAFAKSVQHIANLKSYQKNISQNFYFDGSEGVLK